YAEAGEAEIASEWWTTATRRALERGAMREGVQHARRGLAVLAAAPAGTSRDAREFHLQFLLGAAHSVVAGYASTESRTAYARGYALRDAVADPLARGLLLLGLWAAVINADGPAAAQAFADDLLRLAESSGGGPVLVMAHFAECGQSGFAGDFA